MTEDQALQLLERSVRALRSAGALTYAAGVKARMKQLAEDEYPEGFSEESLGLPNFRSFLNLALARGIVRLVTTPSGDDFEVFLRDEPSRPVARRLRHDLWNAFIHWPDGNARAYDRILNQVVTCPHEELERLRTSEPTRFVEIPENPRSATRDLMLAFLEQVPAGTPKSRLEEALLDESDPEKKFVDALRGESRLLARWRADQTDHYSRVVEEWAKTHEVSADLYEAKPEPPRVRGASARRHVPASHPREREAGLSSGEIQVLRARVIAAVQRMPLADLLRMPIPIEYLLSD